MAEFYAARGWEIPPLPWTNLSPPFSDLLLGAAHLFEQAHDYAELVPIDPKPSH